jgi:uncharacterized protein YgiM (DUF1202 family)
VVTRQIITRLVGGAVLLTMVLGPRGITTELSIGPVVRAAPVQQDGGAIAAGRRLWIAGTGAAGLNVRSAPQLGSDLLGSLHDGDLVQVLEGPVAADGINWYRVDSTSRADSGWVDSRFLSATEPGLPAASNALAAGSRLWVAGTGAAGLNVRSAPQLGSDLLGSLHDGDLVRVVEGPVGADGINWYRVEATARADSGWVDGEALSPTPP